MCRLVISVLVWYAFLAHCRRVDSKRMYPLIIEGRGHTSLTNVDAFSGGNGALSNLGDSKDFMWVRGEENRTINMVACRMKNYQADYPITLRTRMQSYRPWPVSIRKIGFWK